MNAMTEMEVLRRDVHDLSKKVDKMEVSMEKVVDAVCGSDFNNVSILSRIEKLERALHDQETLNKEALKKEYFVRGLAAISTITAFVALVGMLLSFVKIKS